MTGYRCYAPLENKGQLVLVAFLSLGLFFGRLCVRVTRSLDRREQIQSANIRLSNDVKANEQVKPFETPATEISECHKLLETVPY